MRELSTLELRGRIVFLGVGNTMRGDDGAGSLLAQRLKGNVPWIVYDAAQSPENYLGKVVKDAPEHIIIADAADFGGAPGDVKVVAEAEFPAVQFCTTHNASLSLTIDYLRETSGARIIIMAIQPGSTSLGGELSPAVSAAIDRAESGIRGIALTRG